jgi:hypothetical protein
VGMETYAAMHAWAFIMEGPLIALQLQAGALEDLALLASELLGTWPSDCAHVRVGPFCTSISKPVGRV